MVWDDDDASDVIVHVQDALDRSALIPDDSDVIVDTSGNTVTQAGHVRTWAEDDAAIGAAWMTKGRLRSPRRHLRHRLTTWHASQPGSSNGRPTGSTVPGTGPASRGSPGLTGSRAGRQAGPAPPPQHRQRRPVVPG